MSFIAEPSFIFRAGARSLSTRYVTELTDCILESVASGTFKLKDLPAATEVCAMFHRSYEDFGLSMETSLQKAWTASSPVDLAKRRIYIRFAGEGALLGMVKERLFCGFFQEVCDSCSSSTDPEVVLNGFAILASVMQKQGLACTGLLSKTQKEMQELINREWKYTKACVLSEAIQSQLACLVTTVYQTLAGSHLKVANSQVQELEKQILAMKIDKGTYQFCKCAGVT